MKVYIVVDEEMPVYDGKLDEFDINREYYNAYSSLDLAIESLINNGYKANNMYKRQYAPRTVSNGRVSDLYWYDYCDGLVSCSWVEEREVKDFVEYVSDEDNNMWRKCCSNCVYWQWGGVWDIDCVESFCMCEEDDCPHHNTLELDSSGKSEDKACCKYFKLGEEPWIEY